MIIQIIARCSLAIRKLLVSYKRGEILWARFIRRNDGIDFKLDKDRSVRNPFLDQFEMVVSIS
jgi:hypothetical protein